MKKKGFTLVEIIISISIILIVATATTFFVFNKNKNLKNITKEILEAANLYIKIEKDNNGNIYANEIVNGAKGVKIPLTNLVSSGYIKEELANEIYKSNDELEDNQDYYVMFVEDTANYCDDGSFVAITSWMDKGDNIYLCDNFNDGKTSGSLIENILKDYTNIKILDSITDDDYIKTVVNVSATQTYGDYYASPWSLDNSFYSVKESGLFKKNDGTHYFRGNIEDNYVKIADEIFRIISFKDNEIKLIKESPVVDDNWMSGGSFSYGACVGINFDSIEAGINNYIRAMFASYYGNINFIIQSSCEGVECEYAYATLLSEEEAIYAGVPKKTIKINPGNSAVENSMEDGTFIAEHWLNNSNSTLLLFDFNNPPDYPKMGMSDRCSDIKFGGGTVLIITNRFSESIYDKVCTNCYQYDENNILNGTFLEFGLFREGDYIVANILNKSVRPVITIDNNLTSVTGKGTKNSPYVLNLK